MHDYESLDLKQKIAYVKGAPEVILEKSSGILRNGKWKS
jgi:magnesium-transporting ATPase (P-type)